MFRSRRAWFSQSVAPELCGFWVAEGGVITNHKDADYLFSSNASHPDTKRIHESLDFLEDRVEVFHACYLNASANSVIKTTVPLGHFLLPPACLQEEIREKNGSFIWEQLTEPLKPQPSVPVEAKCSRNDQKLTGTRGLKTRLDSGSQHPPESCREDYQTPGTPERTRLEYVLLRDYPASNMMTGYDSAKEMKQFLGDIRDFIPGCSGYLAYCIQNETSFFSDRKAKWKQKL